MDKPSIQPPKASLVWITPNAEGIIAEIARVSNPNNQKNPNYTGLIKFLIKNAHWSPFEMVSMAVEINTSRAISAQILRHRSFHYQEFSQRYAAIDNTGVVIYAARRQDSKNRQNSLDDLSEEIKQEWEARQLDNWRRAFEHYQWALDHEIAKESARMVLPMQTATRMYMVGTLRDWIFYILIRSDPSTQKEHRDIALAVKDVFVREFPIISDALGWKT